MVVPLAPMFNEYDSKCYDLCNSLNTLSCANCHKKCIRY